MLKRVIKNMTDNFSCVMIYNKERKKKNNNFFFGLIYLGIYFYVFLSNMEYHLFDNVEWDY